MMREVSHVWPEFFTFISILSDFLLIYLGFCKKFLTEIFSLPYQHWEPVCNFHELFVHGTSFTLVHIFQTKI